MAPDPISPFIVPIYTKSRSVYSVMMDDQQNRYIKTLLWAYERHQEGFTLSELKELVGITDDEWRWWHRVFITTNDNDRKLIDLYEQGDDGNFYRYTLNDKGMAVVLDYLELQQAREESYKANQRAESSKKIAIGSLCLTFLALLVGIVSAYFQIQSNNDTSTQLNILTAKAKLDAGVFTYDSIYTKITETRRMGISLRNEGYADTEFWYFYFLPCTYITISDLLSEESDFGTTNEGGYWIRGEGKLIHEQAFFLDQVDGIGSFNVSFATSTPLVTWGEKKVTPLFLIHTSGQNVVPTWRLSYVEWIENKSEFRTVEVLSEEGRFFLDDGSDEDYDLLLKTCGR